MPKLEVYMGSWGVMDNTATEAEWMAVLDNIAAMGYAGLEAPVAFVMAWGSKKFEAAMQARGLKWIAQMFSSGGPGGPPVPQPMGITSDFGIAHPPCDNVNTHNVQAHKDVWAAQVDEAAALKSVLKQATSHTGKDYFTEAEADEMFAFCIKYAASKGVQVHHETHRARILYSPWVVRRLLAAHPGLTLVADLSHYTVVAEAGFADPELSGVVAELTPRVRHVHARVGHEEGPQVPDPRVPRWLGHYEGFKKWWMAIYEAQAAAGAEVCTTLPEFGPATYVPIDPKTDEPIADIREINHAVGREVSAMFAARFGAGTAPALPEVLKR